MASANNISLIINNQNILNNISCDLLPGRITTFMGASGAGKTSLLRCLAGLVTPDAGEITVQGCRLKDIGMQKKSQIVGLVFQNFNLFNNFNVLNNCVDPLLLKGLSLDDATKKARMSLNRLGMLAYINRYPAELSQGQQQRVAIARALCLDPTLLLFDEPSASLDPINTTALIDILKNLAKDGIAIGVSSQDMIFLNAILDRAYFLKNGEVIECYESDQSLENYPHIKEFLGNSYG